jgi:hypothetical protein
MYPDSDLNTIAHPDPPPLNIHRPGLPAIFTCTLVSDILPAFSESAFRVFLGKEKMVGVKAIVPLILNLRSRLSGPALRVLFAELYL